MNLTRLMALGTLARYGPQHGHQIRRLADLTDVGEWGGVSAGALYRDLRAMEREGLVETLRTEQVGRRPARTVYAITLEGRAELTGLRAHAIATTDTGPDALAVALIFAVDDVGREELRDALLARRDRLAISGRELAADRERGLAKGYLSPLESATMRRGEMRIETEVRWHNEMDALLATGLPLGGNATRRGAAARQALLAMVGDPGAAGECPAACAHTEPGRDDGPTPPRAQPERDDTPALPGAQPGRDDTPAQPESELELVRDITR